MYTFMRCLVISVAVLVTGCASNKVSVWVENDAFGGGATDENYTNGIHVAIQPTKPYEPCDRGLRAFGDCETDGWRKKLINWLNILESDDFDNPDDIWVEYGIGQQMYTPNDLSIPVVQPNDRPYAGWLYGSLHIHNDRTKWEDTKENWLADRRRTVTTKLGIVGPSSLADSAQKWVHERCGCTKPQGWHLQVKDEPGIVFAVSQEDRIWYTELSDTWRGDILTRGELSIGNVYTGVDVGATLRFGYNLPRQFSPQTISPHALFFTPAEQRQSIRDSYVFGFIGIIGRLIGRDIFLDGNTWRTSIHTVDKETFVSEAQVGVGIGYKKWSVQFLFAERSEQYKTQVSPHRFGSFVVSYSTAW